MKILLHICCAPCAIFPVRQLRQEDFTVAGYFYRNNIHPYTECLRRQDALAAYAEQIDLTVIYQKEYDMEEFIRNVVFRESDRCAYCYHERLKSTALVAKRGKFDCFSTTLLYSKFQKHDMIRTIGESVGKSAGLPFYYQDFRTGCKAGVEES